MTDSELSTTHLKDSPVPSDKLPIPDDTVWKQCLNIPENLRWVNYAKEHEQTIEFTHFKHRMTYTKMPAPLNVSVSIPYMWLSDVRTVQGRLWLRMANNAHPHMVLPLGGGSISYPEWKPLKGDGGSPRHVVFVFAVRFQESIHPGLYKFVFQMIAQDGIWVPVAQKESQVFQLGK